VKGRDAVACGLDRRARVDDVIGARSPLGSFHLRIDDGAGFVGAGLVAGHEPFDLKRLGTIDGDGALDEPVEP
jgi:hypothetical protein